MPLSEEMRRLSVKLALHGNRNLTGSQLALLITQVSSDMRAADPGPEPYDPSARRKRSRRKGSGIGLGLIR